MTLYNLMREYEERRQALVDQLQRNPQMEPAEQHQIYGAIKEIEHFIRAIEGHISVAQGQQSIDLAQDRPRPFIEKTRRIASGTRSVFTQSIPGAAKKIVTAPRTYFDKRRERRALKDEVEREVRARMQQSNAPSIDLPTTLHEERVPTEELPTVEEHLEPEFSSTHGTPSSDIAEARDEMPRKVPRRMRAGRARKVARPAAKASPPARQVTVTRKGAPLGKHPKRAKSLVRHGRHPGLHSQGNRGGQHKPHHKGKRFRR